MDKRIKGGDIAFTLSSLLYFTIISIKRQVIQTLSNSIIDIIEWQLL